VTLRDGLMSRLDEALRAPKCVISVMGAHAGEDAAVIFSRKIADCDTVGRTFWVARSPKARPEQVQALCAAGYGYVLFVEPATSGGARATSLSETASEYSRDRTEWLPLPDGLSPVTGQMDRLAAALVFDRLTTEVHGAIDLWEYAAFADATRPLRFTLGCSTVCASRRTTAAHPDRMKSRYRGLVAVGRLAEPYCVWVR
jgi:hypothetical protein